MEDIRVSHTRN